MGQEFWKPKTKLGKKVIQGKISLEEIFNTGLNIKEPQITDKLLPNLQEEVILIGGTPGKGGGIRRTPTSRTTRMHRSGRRYKINSMAVVGNRDGYIGMGTGSAKDHSQAIEKAITNAKLNIIPIKRGCGSWECGCGENHSIPFSVEGKYGSVRINLIPAPKGVGLCISDEAKKIMELAGVEDIWSKTFGETRTRNNLIGAIFDAFKNINTMKTGKGKELEQKHIYIKEETNKKEDKETGQKENNENEDKEKTSKSERETKSEKKENNGGKDEKKET